MGAEDAAAPAATAPAADAAPAAAAPTAPAAEPGVAGLPDMEAAAEAAAAAMLEAGNPLLDPSLIPGMALEDPSMLGLPPFEGVLPAVEEDQGFAQAYAAASREQYPDACSVYIGNLDGQDEIWPEQLYEHFKLCGEVKRVTIKIDKVTGDRMGFAYVDFGDATAAETALSLDGSDFRGRHIKVNKKRSYQHNPNDWGKGKGKCGGFGKGFGKGYGKGKGWGWKGMDYGGYGPCYGKGWGKGKGWGPY